VLRHGTGALSIDECRIAGTVPQTMQGASSRIYGGGNGFAPEGKQLSTPSDLGRWPANLCHSGEDEVLALFPQSKSTAAPVSNPMKRQDNQVYGKGLGSIGPENIYTDAGSAARFFFSAKAGTEDRWGSRHPTVKPVALMKWLVQLVTPLRGIVLDPFAGSGTTGVAALATGRDAILIERESNWFNDIQERIGFYEGEGKHSLQAKARRIATPRGAMPLFEVPA